MATSAIVITQYQGQQAQNLRNVPILLPSIVAVEQGEKQFQWHGRWIRFHKKNWLLIPAHSRITFVNNPHQTQFRSTQISFLIPPTAEMIQLSQQNADMVSNHLDSPEFIVDDEGRYLWQLLLSLPKELSQAIQQQLVNGLYQYFAEKGQLHLLYAPQEISWTEKLTQFFSQDPSQNYTIEQVCQQFGLSKATLMRRLNDESTQFREVLAQVRMGHALSLLQEKSQTVLELAQQCGYQSEVRFTQRFQKQFGLSPKQYQKTLHPM
ncbi:helix-turn-helix transcriptional regulator [Photobacterium damselae]|uniref:helix-turn-helix transcriptional regulator n=2 Tax=Photobacterium damselae TaxID=38293 RepID=UPI003D7EFF3D